jgi:hypothetical protein
MMLRLLFSITAALTILLSGSSSTGTPEALRAASTQSDDAAIRATNFRLTSGLDASPARVAASLTNSEAFPDTTFGVPLTTEEATEIRRRVAVQLEADEGIASAQLIATSGGAYMDQDDDGRTKTTTAELFC